MENFKEKNNNLENIIIGRNPVLEALKSDEVIDTLYISSMGGIISHIVSLAKDKNITIKTVSDKKLSSMCDNKSHQGVIATIGSAEYVSVEDILEVSKSKGTQPFIVICDEIEDPHNLGAIIRTCETAGVDGIIIPKRRSATLNATVRKTSAGAVSYVPVARVANLATTIDFLKNNNVWIYGTDATGNNYTDMDLTGGIALVIGSEGFGMGKLIKDKCDFLLSLPMYGKVNSLNASVAGGIFIYEALRQRLNKLK